MFTLITVQKNDGSKRQCDGRCYNATSCSCTCVCLGLNHGIGLREAIRQTSIYKKDFLERYKGARKVEIIL